MQIREKDSGEMLKKQSGNLFKTRKEGRRREKWTINHNVENQSQLVMQCIPFLFNLELKWVFKFVSIGHKMCQNVGLRTLRKPSLLNDVCD